MVIKKQLILFNKRVKGFIEKFNNFVAESVKVLLQSVAKGGRKYQLYKNIKLFCTLFIAIGMLYGDVTTAEDPFLKP